MSAEPTEESIDTAESSLAKEPPAQVFNPSAETSYQVASGLPVANADSTVDLASQTETRNYAILKGLTFEGHLSDLCRMSLFGILTCKRPQVLLGWSVM